MTALSSMPRALWQGLIDDAGIFPPASLSLPDALDAHLAQRSGPLSWMVGPLLVRASVLDEADRRCADRGGSLPLRIGVVMDGPATAATWEQGLADDTDRLRALAATSRPGLHVSQVELALADEDGAAPLAELTAALAPVAPTAVVYVEPVPGSLLSEAPGRIDELRQRLRGRMDVRAKVRTGGVTAAATPPAADLAAFLVGCAQRRLPCKATAGLHHALRHWEPSVAGEQHGFLNVLAAAGQASRGMDAETVASTLELRDVHQLVLPTTQKEAEQLRCLFRSFGSCSVDEPAADLADLGIISTSSPTRS